MYANDILLCKLITILTTMVIYELRDTDAIHECIDTCHLTLTPSNQKITWVY